MPYWTAFRPPYPAQLLDELLAHFSLNTQSRVLDLGCGTGHVALPLAERLGWVTALDPDADLLSEAQRLAAERGLNHLEFVRATAEAYGPSES